MGIETFSRNLTIWLMGLPFGYVLVNIVYMVHGVVYEGGVLGSWFYGYLVACVVMCVLFVRFDLVAAIGSGIKLGIGYWVYYLYSLIPGGVAMQIYYEYRSIVLVGFIIIFVLLGVAIMLSRGASLQLTAKQSSGSLGAFENVEGEKVPGGVRGWNEKISVLIRQVVLGLILMIFSYAIAETIYNMVHGL
jgi:hypothetical protein